jgi:PKD repeat protein
MEGETVVFDGSASHDPDGQALTHTWTFGDGSPAVTGASVAHAYASPGRYTVSLKVSDGALSATATAAVTVASFDHGAPGVFHDGFDRPDSPSPGGAWAVVRGQAGVLNQRLVAGAVRGNHIAVVHGLHGSAQQAGAQFHSANNNAGPRFGIVLRYQDPQNYYVMYRLAGGVSALRISRVAGGKEAVLKQVRIKNPVRNVPFHLTASASGEVLTLDVDGASRLAVTDTTFTEGAVGVSLGRNGKGFLLADDFAASVQ